MSLYDELPNDRAGRRYDGAWKARRANVRPPGKSLLVPTSKEPAMGIIAVGTPVVSNKNFARNERIKQEEADQAAAVRALVEKLQPFLRPEARS